MKLGNLGKQLMKLFNECTNNFQFFFQSLLRFMTRQLSVTSLFLKKSVFFIKTPLNNFMVHQNRKRINLIFLFLRYFDSVSRSYVN